MKNFISELIELKKNDYSGTETQFLNVTVKNFRKLGRAMINLLLKIIQI